MTQVVAGSIPVSHPIFTAATSNNNFRNKAHIGYALISFSLITRWIMAAAKVKTRDQNRTRVDELNAGVPSLLDSRRKWLAPFVQVYRNLALVMAGMYIGQGCSGTPDNQNEDEGGSVTNDRPI